MKMQKNARYWWEMYARCLKENLELEKKIKLLEKRIEELNRKISSLV